MMNMPLMSRTKFCSLQDTKAAVVLGGLIVAGLAGSVVAGDAQVLAAGFDWTGSIRVQTHYEYRHGGSDCSSLYTFGREDSGSGESTITYIDIRNALPDSENYDAGICDWTSQEFTMISGGDVVGIGGTGSVSVRLGENTLPGSNIFTSRRTNIEASAGGYSRLYLTDFAVGRLGAYAGFERPDFTEIVSQNIISGVRSPHDPDLMTSYTTPQMLWPGLYTFHINGNVELENTLVNSRSYYGIGGSMSISLTNPDVAPPLCTGTNRCADYNNDGNFDLSDLYGWYASPMDVTGDELFDADPYSDDASWIAGMLLATDDTLNDCNENGFPDVYDIFIGSPFGGSDDANGDGVPDDCQVAACPADLTGDGSLDFFDVSAFLTAFAASDSVADFTGDGSFDFFDVSAFLQAFSAGCP